MGRLFVDMNGVRGWRAWALVLAAYLVLVVAATFPVAFRLFGGTVSEPELDLYCHLWDIWWGFRTFVERQGSYLFTDHLHYPPGIATSDFLSGPLLFLVAGLLRALLGDLKATFNVVALLSLLVSCLGGYSAGRLLLKDRAAAFYVGVAVAFNPMVFLQLRVGLVEFVNLGWGMLFLGSLVPLRERMDARSALVSLLWFVVASTWAWYMGPLLLVLAAFFLLATTELRALRASGGRRVALLLGWAAATVAFVLFSFSVTSVASVGRELHLAEARIVGQLEARNVRRLEEVTSLGINAPEGMPSFEVKLNNSIDPVRSFTAFGRYAPGSAFFLLRWAVPLLLAAAALALARSRAALAWTGAVGFSALLALGPCLVVDGAVWLGSWSFTPFGLLGRLAPELGRMQFPNRMVLLVAMALALLAGAGLEALLARLRLRGIGRAIAVGAAALLTAAGGVSLLEFPLPQAPLPVPRFYERLARAPGRTALINVPFVEGRAVIRRECLARDAYYQTTHHKLDLSGPVPAVMRRSSRPASIARNELLVRLAELTDGRPHRAPTERERRRLLLALSELRAHRFDAIVLHRLDLRDGAFRGIKALLDGLLPPPESDTSVGGDPAVADPLLVYRLPGG
jgi:hypothetical protein